MSSWHYCGCVTKEKMVTILWIPLLFYFDVPCQDGGYFTLHEGPGHIGANQRAPLTTRAVNLTSCPLLLDAFSGAWEAKFMGGHRWALYKVSVLQAFVAQGAAQWHTARWHWRVWNALWGCCMGVDAACWMGARWVGAAWCCPETFPLRQPPLGGWGWWQRAATVPPCTHHSGVYLIAVLRWACAACVVSGKDECCHGRLAILSCGCLWGCSAGVGRDGGRGSSRKARQCGWGHL